VSSKIAVDFAASFLAGQEKKRAVFLKNLVLKSVLANESVGENVAPAYLNGHYFKTKRYLKWVNKAQGYLHAVGLAPLKVLQALSGADMAQIAALVEPLVDNPDGHDFHMHGAQVRTATLHDYAERFIKENHPEWAARNFVAESTNEAGDEANIYIAAAGQPAPELPEPATGYEHLLSFTIPDYDESTAALIVQFALQSQQPAPLDPAPFMPGTEIDEGYDTVPRTPSPGYAQHGPGWVQDDGWTVQSWEYTQLKFVETSSGDAYWVDWGTVYGPVVPAPIHWKEYRRQPPQSYAFEGLYPNEIARLYEVEHIGVQQGDTGETTSSTTSWPGMHQAMAGTFYQSVEKNVIGDMWWYRKTGRVEDILLHADIARTFIYVRGSGNGALDAIIDGALGGAQDAGVPSPPRPLIINHTTIDELGDRINVGHRKHWMDTPWDVIRAAANNYTGDDPNPAHKLVNMAARKQTGKGIHKMLKELKGHDDFKDFSYVYYFDGVPLNTRRKYLTRYVWEYLRGFAAGGQDVDAHIANILAYNQQVQDYYEWLDALEAKAKGTATPAQLLLAGAAQKNLPQPPDKSAETEIRWGRDNDWASWIHYSLCMYGCFGSESILPGQQLNTYTNKPAKKGECWITNTQHAAANDERLAKTLDAHVTTFWYQEDLNTCRRYRIANLRFEKWVWRWGYVSIAAHEALQEPDESRFFCLILQQPLKSIGIVGATQVLCESALLEIDVYVQRRKKFGFAQIVGFVVSIVVAVFYPPAGGYYFGLQGFAGAVATAATNVVVASVVSTVAVQVFGAQLGSIVAFAAGSVALSLMAGANFSTSLAGLRDTLSTAEGLLRFTNAIGDAYQAHAAEKIMRLQGDFNTFMQGVKEERNYLNELMRQSGLDNAGGVDARQIMQALKQAFNNEAPDDFLRRTLATGSDIAQMSMDFISQHAGQNLALKY